MQKLRQRISYLQGLAEGMNVGASSREGRLLTEMLQVLGDMADTIDTLKAEQERLDEIVESMDDDLFQLEQDIYEDDDDEDDEDIVEIACPSCQENVCFDAELLDDDDYLEVTCPSCRQVIFVQEGDEDMEERILTGGEEECGCDCDDAAHHPHTH
ncbi:AraC family transcriptional regulator [Heliobacterium undosum]|uniref:AraC family transcriptional regulator n=1 Tax=Heliomicrobium undosum TaxID=121734 RepID=A0A845L6D2_9FIRM|nr:CD1247 N-terminal domain-containing protein [Heliomicrobium undosum]MZP28471.1 AraC family transcriptional regulator [Heliomicrobium undosum]